MITMNRVIPIIGGIVVVIAVAVALKSGERKPKPAMLNDLPTAASPDVDTPADTVRSLSAQVAQMVDQTRRLTEENQKLREQNAAAMDQEKLDNQREVVINERRQKMDNQPYGRAFERLQELLYPPGHPYSWPVIGSLEDLQAATLDDVREFYDRYYGANNATLVIAGDIAFHQRLLTIFEYTDTAAWVETWDAFEALEPEIVIPGHGEPTTLDEVTKYTKGYLTYMRGQIGELIEEGGDLQSAYLVDQGDYAHLDTYRELAKRNAGLIFRAMEFE